jgi:hypothetical protein
MSNYFYAEKRNILSSRLFIGSVGIRGKLRHEQTDAYQKLYQAAEIRSRSAATRWTWITRRRASETVWLM